MKDPLLRNLELLRLLPRAPRRIDAASLEHRLRALGFRTTRRMIQRDLVALAAQYPIDCIEGGKPYGWAWSADAAPPVVPSLDVPTALLYRLAELHLAELLPAGVRAALAPHFLAAGRLLGAASDDVESLADRVRLVPSGFAGRPPAVDEGVLTAVTEAVAARCVVDAEYAARGRAEPRPYRLHALGLVLRGGVLTLVAGVEGPARGDEPAPVEPRSFVLHRFRQATCTTTPARVPPGFTLDAHVAAAGLFVRHGDVPIDLVVLVEAEAAATVLEGDFGPDQRITRAADGRVTLQVRTRDTQALRAWLLGFGPLAEVRGPPALRAWFAETTAALAARYAVPTGAEPTQGDAG